MPAIDLVFKQLWKSGNPVDLVFGDDDGGSGVPDAALVIAARMPGLRVRAAVHVRKDLVGAGRMPGVRCRGAVRYNTDTARPLVAKVATKAQDDRCMRNLNSTMLRSFATKAQDDRRMIVPALF